MAIGALAYGAAMAAPGILKGLTSWRHKAPQQQVSSDTTAYLNKLRQVSKEGLYGQDVKNEIGADIQQSANMTNQNLRNLSVSQGTENSGVIAQQLLQSGGQTTLQAARMAKQIAQMNEQSKLEASATASTVGQGVKDIHWQNALARREREQNIAGSFGEGIASGVAGYQDQFEYLKGGGNKKTRKSILHDPDRMRKLKELFPNFDWD